MPVASGVSALATRVGQECKALWEAVNGKASASHHDHTWVDHEYFYESISGENNLTAILESAPFSCIRYATPSAVEYHDGTNWVAWAGGDAVVKVLLNGQDDTVGIDNAHRRFRFTVYPWNGYPLKVWYYIQTFWQAMAFPSCTMTIEMWNGTAWIPGSSATFGSGTTGPEWGKHGRVTNGIPLHTNQAPWRISVEFAPFANTSLNVSLARIELLSGYTGAKLLPFSWNWDRIVRFASIPTVNGTNLALTNDSRFSDARTPTPHSHDASTVFSGGTVPQARLAQNLARVVYTTVVPARPAGATYVEWVGNVDPGANAVAGDTWVPTT